MPETVFTPSGVRLRKHSARAGDLNWLLLPGGPGIGSESLDELATALNVPGAVWLVDLPGDGSNRAPPGAAGDPFAAWPQVLVEAARALPNVVFAGHSTGGMYLLATPELERHIVGLALLDTAPDAAWHRHFVAMTARHPLPEVEAATAVYERDRRDGNIAAIAVASAEWNFTAQGLAAGRALLARMPYNAAAADWSEDNFDHVYRALWWPATLPVLVLAGSDDRIVWQGGWGEDRFHTANALFRAIPGGGHFPWIENPTAVAAAFGELAAQVRPV
ncbi:alpha/beta fold hydrolase [Novosphingobium album (ex Liu et al. 2023)]|uniref:Alpha/beta hydrolase n=1 Tax=Novosphingobium album (ex Liu et al. 2023) TaxID=3031130 RepID=A0ABT5WJD2_9SPHN|nr:alpha/beta hydrolase [Novosphingobium album (ex Liu et al. 2023)]MDE8650152.1 alpha/beta hydrolase [Novosphingobium album (ex Liu et al. 2023)]